MGQSQAHSSCMNGYSMGRPKLGAAPAIFAAMTSPTMTQGYGILLSPLRGASRLPHIELPMAVHCTRPATTAATDTLVWCIRSSALNKWVLYANPFLRFEQESGFLSQAEARYIGNADGVQEPLLPGEEPGFGGPAFERQTYLRRGLWGACTR